LLRRPHGDADICRSQRGCVIDSVAHHHNLTEVATLLERAHDFDLELDRQANHKEVVDSDIAANDSPVRVLVVHAREELVAARAARRVLRETRKQA
jgi:acetate kinase